MDAVAALNESFGTADAKRDFLKSCRKWLQQLNDNPVNYGHRRRHFTAEWRLSQEDWQELQKVLIASGRAHRPTIDRRHGHYSVWVWSLVTSSYARYAPMIQTRDALTGDPDKGAMGFMNKVKHSKGGDDHAAFVHELASRIAVRIDETAPALPEHVSQPLGKVS